MASTFRQLANIATFGSSSTWRTDIETLREEGNYDAALDVYKRLGREKDKVVEELILGQQAEFLSDKEGANTHWSSLLEASAKDSGVIEAHARLAMLIYDGNNNEPFIGHLHEVSSFLEQLDEPSLRESTFTAYRLSIMTELLLQQAKQLENQQNEEIVRLYELVEKTILKFYEIYPNIHSDRCRDHYEEAVFSLTLGFDTENERKTLIGWRNALNSPISPSETHTSQLLANVSRACLYYFRTNNMYPNYEHSNGDELERFTPISAAEESLLASLLSSAQDTDDVHIYDDLLFCLGTENATKYSFKDMERIIVKHSENEHLWTQFALSLLDGGRAQHAFAIIEQILEVKPHNISIILFGAKVCLNNLKNVSKAAEFASRAISECENSPKDEMFLCRAYHYLAVCHSALAVTVFSIERNTLHKKALNLFKAAAARSCSDYLFLFHYALELAEVRDVHRSLEMTKQSLSLCDSYVPSWLLLVLLMTSQKLYDEALCICKMALEKENDKRFIYCSAVIHFHKKNYTEALSILKNLCIQINTPVVGEGLSEGAFHSPLNMSADDISERTATSQVSFSSNNSKNLKRRNEKFGSLDVWLLLSEIFETLGKLDDASHCVDEAAKITPFHPDVFYRRGCLVQCSATLGHENGMKGNAKEDPIKAIQLFQTALSCDPDHEKSIIKIAEYHFENQDYQMAKNFASTAVRKFPFSSSGWFIFSRIMKTTNDIPSAASYAAISLEIENSSPLLPFSLIPREL